MYRSDSAFEDIHLEACTLECHQENVETRKKSEYFRLDNGRSVSVGL